MRNTTISLALILLVAGASTAAGQDYCRDILKFGIFEKHEQVETRYLVTQAQHFYCRTSIGSASQSTGFNLNIATVVDALPLEIGGAYRDQDERTWRDQVCKYDWNSLTDWSTKRISIEAASSTIANAWSQCMNSQQNGVVAGITFSTPEDFILTVKLNGLPEIPALTYNLIYPVRSGIAFQPPEAARLIDPFGVITRQPGRQHVFRGKRSGTRPFTVLVASKPNPTQVEVPSPVPVAQAPTPPKFVKTFLADLKPRVIEGIYSPRSCYGTSVITVSDGTSHPDSIVVPPGGTGATAVEWIIPFGAKTFAFDGAAFCHEPGKRDCMDSNNGYPASRYWIFADDQLLKSGALGGRHDLPPSLERFPAGGMSFDVKGKRRLRIETDDHGQGRWCDHTTILNPRFE